LLAHDAGRESIMSREIPPPEWKDFFDEFSRTHRAWRAMVDSIGPGDATPVRIAERPLRSIGAEMDANRIVRLHIQFQKDPEPRSDIDIARPVSVRVDDTPEGTTRGVEIIDEEGVCTRIRFRAAPPIDALDGLAPGELASE
jgi:hypothetical protein